MNYIIFIFMSIVFILLCHTIYSNVYDSINNYTTYEKNINYIEEENI